MRSSSRQSLVLLTVLLLASVVYVACDDSANTTGSTDSGIDAPSSGL